VFYMMLQLSGSSSRWTAFFLLCLALCSLLTPAGKSYILSGSTVIRID